MSQQELLKKVIKILEEIEIEYMVTGSIVSSLQGEPRSTHDIDIIIVIKKSAINRLVEYFPFPDFYLDKNSIVNAIDRQDMFNLIDVKEGNKVDFWLLTEEAYDRSRFSRKYVEEFEGTKIQVTSPEDTILAKLRWAKLSGGSEKQFIDALRVYEVQFECLDKNYMEYWVRELSIEPLWERLKNEAEIEER
jgi:hypothetical protein